MHNIYEKEGKEMTDDAKLRLLYQRVQHPGLKAAVEALKAQKTVGLKITYTRAVNHLSTAVSELPDYISKNKKYFYTWH